MPSPRPFPEPVRSRRADRGQDLFEYALLGGVIGLMALTLMQAMGVTLADGYAAWNAAVQSLWIPPDPTSP